MDKRVEQLVNKRLFLVQESVGIAHGTAQDTADNVACFCIARQLAVGNREGNGTHVVGNNAHCNVYLLLFGLCFSVLARWRSEAVLLSAQAFYLLNGRLEDVGVVV